jgi:hypothetical protein
VYISDPISADRGLGTRLCSMRFLAPTLDAKELHVTSFPGPHLARMAFTSVPLASRWSQYCHRPNRCLRRNTDGRWIASVAKISDDDSGQQQIHRRVAAQLADFAVVRGHITYGLIVLSLRPPYAARLKLMGGACLRMPLGHSTMSVIPSVSQERFNPLRWT